MSGSHLRPPAAIAWTAALILTCADAEPARITVEPTCTREIQGISLLDRTVYFAIADNGIDLDGKVPDHATYDHLVHHLNARFGRSLGPVMEVTNWGDLAVEDGERPGRVDLEDLREKLGDRLVEPSAQMRADFGRNLNVAAHGHPDAWPDYMGRVTTEDSLKDAHPKSLPADLEAVTELAVEVFRSGYNDFDRPAYYEPINEPHWSFAAHPHLADWHLATDAAFDANIPGTMVGGPCMSVSYMFRQNYRTWNGFREFIDNTGAGLDFYSFHTYDYLQWRDGDFHGRIQSGLPLEGTLDLIQNHTVNRHGRTVPLVVSEHGGYVTGNSGLSADQINELIAAEHFPGEGFEWEMKKRSIVNFNHVSSIVANTLTFMDHPHTVLKSVPFILLQSFAWDPKYYATLFTPYGFEDTTRWVPTRNTDFYELFRDVRGRRVATRCSDPDLQVRAFAEGKLLFVVINNLWTTAQPIDLDLPAPAEFRVRRLGRNRDFTPYLVEDRVDSVPDLTVQGRETLVITAEYEDVIPEDRRVNETPHYGDRIIAEANGEEKVIFTVGGGDGSNLEYADLRIGFRRPAATDHRIHVLFNGEAVDLPVEDCAARLETEDDFASMRTVRLAADLIRPVNTVTLSFPDGKGGTVGSVVLRTAAAVAP
jgi:hypothetical protein